MGRERPQGRAGRLPGLTKVLADARASMWVLPAVLSVAGLAAALLLPQLEGLLGGYVPVWLATSPGGVRNVLGAAAGALATIAGVAFTLTSVTLQLAATQYSARILRSFMADRATQFVLGEFLATVTYLLVLLANVRSPDEGRAFVPRLAFAVGLLATLACLGSFAYFVSHVLRMIEVETIVSGIGKRTLEALRALDVGEPAGPGPVRGTRSAVRAPHAGFVQLTNRRRAARLLPAGFAFAAFAVAPGDFVLEGDVLLEVRGPRPLRAREGRRLRRSLALGRDRTSVQDVLFGVQQLADVALKALSPSVNDETTAVLVANEFVVLVVAAVTCALPVRREPRVFRHRGRTVELPVAGLEELLREGYGTVARAAGEHPRVLAPLARGLRRALEVSQPRFEPALRRAARMLDEATRWEALLPSERARLAERHDREGLHS